MMYRKLLYSILILSGFCPAAVRSQTITNGDGSALTLQYCHENTDFEIAGQPAGGTFSGCGVFQQAGSWVFNPVTATTGLTVFPVSCALTYTIGGSTVTRNILIWKPVVILPPLQDSLTCNGDFLLHATTQYAGDYDYRWSPGSYLTSPDSASTPGHITGPQTFVLTATDVTSGCTGSDTVTIDRAPAPELTVSNDTTINARQKVQLFASGATTYSWMPGRWLDQYDIASPIASPQAPITYVVTGTNEYGCTDTASVFINIRESILIPNAFSPNGDGLNDIFRIENLGYQALKDFYIFNRWGQAVFQTRDGGKGWDGTYHDLPAETGSYHYFIRLQEGQKEARLFKGTLELIR